VNDLFIFTVAHYVWFYTNILFIFELYSGLGHMDPRPVSFDVLYLQAEHRSAHIDLSWVSFYLHY